MWCDQEEGRSFLSSTSPGVTRHSKSLNQDKLAPVSVDEMRLRPKHDLLLPILRESFHTALGEVLVVDVGKSGLPPSLERSVCIRIRVYAFCVCANYVCCVYRLTGDQVHDMNVGNYNHIALCQPDVHRRCGSIPDEAAKDFRDLIEGHLFTGACPLCIFRLILASHPCMHHKGEGCTVIDMTRPTAIHTSKGKTCKRQHAHYDSADGDEKALFSIMLALSDCHFEYHSVTGKKVRLKLRKGQILLFDSRLLHQGAPYPKANTGDNLFLRLFVYCELGKIAIPYGTRIVHLPKVGAFCSL
jgi:hypothetical protein